MQSVTPWRPRKRHVFSGLCLQRGQSNGLNGARLSNSHAEDCCRRRSARTRAQRADAEEKRESDEGGQGSGSSLRKSRPHLERMRVLTVRERCVFRGRRRLRRGNELVEKASRNALATQRWANSASAEFRKLLALRLQGEASGTASAAAKSSSEAASAGWRNGSPPARCGSGRMCGFGSSTVRSRPRARDD